jgi:hypothetical protein
LPPIAVETGAWLPGWALHAAAALVGGGTLVGAAGAVGASVAPFVWVTAGCLAVWLFWRPGHQPALTVIVLVAAVLWLAPGPHPDLVALWAAPAGFLGLRLALWAGATGRAARVEWAALARSGRWDGVVLAVTIAAGTAAVLLGDRPSLPLMLVGGAALLGLGAVAAALFSR